MAGTTERAIVSRRDGATVIAMPAQIDINSEATLDTAYSEVAPAGSLVLNFSGTEYINSSGIALIVGILARARKEHRAVVAYGLSDHYREIFEVTRLADFMGVYADERAALAGKQ
jgi:anti-sigma B factor antagonist